MSKIKNFDLKFQLTNEFLRNGGIEKISSLNLLNDIINVKYDENLKPIEESVGSILRSFMTVILSEHMEDPIISDNFLPEFQSLLQKSYSFDQISIDTEREFDEIYKKFNSANDILFRGQREAKWRLYNTLQREWIDCRINNTENNYKELVKKLVISGKDKYADEIKTILKSYDIDTLNDISVLGYLQHHSCPTPLLDWTYSFKVALFFGIDNLEQNKDVKEIQNYFSVYYLEEENIDGCKELISESLHSVGEKLKTKMLKKISKNKKQFNEMKEHFKDIPIFDKNKLKGSGMVKNMVEVEKLFTFDLLYFSDKNKDLGVLFSLENNNNIKNQKGVFMWNSTPLIPLETLGKNIYKELESDKNEGEYRFCRVININKKLEKYIRNCLNKESITKETIYTEKETNAWRIYEKSLKK